MIVACSGPIPSRPPTANGAHAGERRRELGQALVEFALVVPLLFLFLCGIFEFGNLLLTQIQLQNAVRSGARFAALSGCPSNSAIQAEVQSVAASLPVTVTSSYSPSPCSAGLEVRPKSTE